MRGETKPSGTYGQSCSRPGAQDCWRLWAVTQQARSTQSTFCASNIGWHSILHCPACTTHCPAAQPLFRVQFLHVCFLFISNCSCSSQDNDSAVVPTLGQYHQQGAKTLTGSSILVAVGSHAKTPGAEDWINMRGQTLERDKQSAGTSNLAPVGCHAAGLELRTRLR